MEEWPVIATISCATLVISLYCNPAEPPHSPDSRARRTWSDEVEPIQVPVLSAQWMGDLLSCECPTCREGAVILWQRGGLGRGQPCRLWFLCRSRHCARLRGWRRRCGIARVDLREQRSLMVWKQLLHHPSIQLSGL